jgi:L-methionine (R)-S-oxide reductase
MSEELVIDKSLTIEKQYEELIVLIKNFFNATDNAISIMANLTAILKQNIEKISWVGFYLSNGIQLYLGPFQGKAACSFIELGKGVCGSAALSQQTIIVPDVNKFPGHIVCDSDSRSEIVIPLIDDDDKLIGVLDLDSTSLNAFDETDKKYLEIICNYLVEELF